MFSLIIDGGPEGPRESLRIANSAGVMVIEIKDPVSSKILVQLIKDQMEAQTTS